MSLGHAPLPPESKFYSTYRNKTEKSQQKNNNFLKSSVCPPPPRMIPKLASECILLKQLFSDHHLAKSISESLFLHEKKK